MASYTPSRVPAVARGGYYADASSPIASTPQRGKVASKNAPPTPSAAALSPLRGPSEHPKQRHIPSYVQEAEAQKIAANGSPGSTAGAANGAGWTGIFSPVLKFFNGQEEAAAPYGHGGSSAVPTLGAAPAGRSEQGILANRLQGSLALKKPAGSPAVGMTAAELSHARQAAAIAAAQAAAAEDEAEKARQLAIAAKNKKATTADEEEYEEFNPYLFIKLLPPYQSVAPVAPPIRLAKKIKTAPTINLVLDLDETLVHCSVEPIDDADVRFPVVFNGQDYEVYVRKRPHLDHFLNWIAGRFEVTIFTASQQVYAERLLALLDPEKRFINHRLYRDSCLNVEGNYLKDLNVLGRDLTKTVLVDNSPHAFAYQLDNGIPIESWFEDKKDTELLKLMRFLETLQGVNDVRPIVRERFKTWKLVHEAQLPPGIY